MTSSRGFIGLSFIPDIGPVTVRRLIESFGSPEEVFRADVKELVSVRGISIEKAERIRRFSLWDEVDRCIESSENKGIDILCPDDQDYPEILRELDDAPAVLYLKGEYLPADRFGVAVVGSRRHTQYGEVVTGRLAGDLASAGFTIISGMARGIDALAHKSALARKGRTIAVLGTGPDVHYPAENRGLMAAVAGSGCLISEFPPGTGPAKENFPKRNRLISGLSLGVLVVEAAAGSGSLITAGFALEQNREVFSVPGNITSPASRGTNRLIREGAKMVAEADDIIEELAPSLRGFIRKRSADQEEPTAEEAAVCGVLTREPRHVDAIAAETGLPVQRLLDLMLSLELKEIVRQSGGKRFYLA